MKWYWNPPRRGNLHIFEYVVLLIVTFLICFNLKIGSALYKLVGMTRKRDQQKPSNPPGYWPLQDAKARFSELVRRVRKEGPQTVTVHGREEVVVLAADEFRRLKGSKTGASLIAALQASPDRELNIEPKRAPMPVRDVEL